MNIYFISINIFMNTKPVSLLLQLAPATTGARFKPVGTIPAPLNTEPRYTRRWLIIKKTGTDTYDFGFKFR